MGCDWVVRYRNRLYQVQRQSSHYVPAKGKVTVCAWEDGRLEIRYRGQPLEWKEIGEPPAPEPLEGTREREAQQEKWKPAAGHPWRHADRPASRPWPSASP